MSEAPDEVIALIHTTAQQHGPYRPEEVTALVLGIFEELSEVAPEADWGALIAWVRYAMTTHGEEEASHG